MIIYTKTKTNTQLMNFCYPKVLCWLEQISKTFFFYQGFLSWTLTIHGIARQGRGPSLFLTINSTRSQTFRHLQLCLWNDPPRIFNRISSNYQTATWWSLLPSGISIWLIVNKMLSSVSLMILILDSITAIFHRPAVDLNSHRLWP